MWERGVCGGWERCVWGACGAWEAVGDPWLVTCREKATLVTGGGHYTSAPPFPSLPPLGHVSQRVRLPRGCNLEEPRVS